MENPAEIQIATVDIVDDEEVEFDDSWQNADDTDYDYGSDYDRDFDYNALSESDSDDAVDVPERFYSYDNRYDDDDASEERAGYAMVEDLWNELNNVIASDDLSVESPAFVPGAPAHITRRLRAQQQISMIVA